MTRPTDDLSLTLAESELSPLRALMDGLVVPAFLASSSYWEALKLARAGYSTRHMAAMSEGGGRIAEATRHAKDRQAQRHERTRNDDWAVALPLLEPGLRAALLMWAGATGRGLGSPDFEIAFRQLGLDVGANRRVALLRNLTTDGCLLETAHKVWRLSRPLNEALGQGHDGWALFVGLNLIVPTVVQRFRQVEGAVLSLRKISLDGAGRKTLDQRLRRMVATTMESVAVPLPLPSSKWSQSDHMLITTYHAVWAEQEADSARAGVDLLLTTAVAEALRRIGPWLVARSFVRRRFVERAAELHGLTGQRLYDFVAQRYGLRSANTVRSFLVGPSLHFRAGEVSFNRGLVQEIALAIRSVVGEVYPDGIREEALRERVQRLQGSRVLDGGLWNAAIRTLEEEALIRRSTGVGGSTFSGRPEQWELVAEQRSRLEAGATVLLSRVLSMSHALKREGCDAHADAKVWVVPREFLGELRRRLIDGFDRHASEAGAASGMLSESQRQLHGHSPCDVLLLARVMPLIL